MTKKPGWEKTDTHDWEGRKTQRKDSGKQTQDHDNINRIILYQMSPCGTIKVLTIQ